MHDFLPRFREIGCELIACSTDSHFSHLAWVNTPREKGGLGAMDIPLLADKSMDISRKYGVLKVFKNNSHRGGQKGVLGCVILSPCEFPQPRTKLLDKPCTHHKF